MADDISPYEADTQFTEREVIARVLKLIQRSVDSEAWEYQPATATVAAEWDRKGFPQHSPLDYQNPSYRTSPDSDDLILTIEVKIDGYTRNRDELVKELETEVRTIIATREEARLSAEIIQATVEAAQAKVTLDAAQNSLAAAQRKLEELRAQ